MNPTTNPASLAAAEQEEAEEYLSHKQMRTIARRQAELAHDRAENAAARGDDDAAERHGESVRQFAALYLALTDRMAGEACWCECECEGE